MKPITAGQTSRPKIFRPSTLLEVAATYEAVSVRMGQCEAWRGQTIAPAFSGFFVVKATFPP
jgi:hypothetical protein